MPHIATILLGVGHRGIFNFSFYRREVRKLTAFPEKFGLFKQNFISFMNFLIAFSAQTAFKRGLRSLVYL